MKKGYILGILVMFIIAVIYSLSLGTFFTKLWFYPMLVGTVGILVLVSILFSKMLYNEEALNYKKSQRFWFASGLLVFYIGYLPIILFQDKIAAHSILYITILTLLNVILYGCFAKGFTCEIKN